MSDTVDGRSPTDETHDRWKPMSYKVKLFRQKLPAPEAKQIKCEQTKYKSRIGDVKLFRQMLPEPGAKQIKCEQTKI